MEKGYIHLYTGNGKGKTTAAIGLMVRAAGAGRRIYFGQFMKGSTYGEIKMLKERFPEIILEQYGGGFVFGAEAPIEERNLAEEGMRRARAAMTSGAYDLLVLDEILVAASLGLVAPSAVLALMQEKPVAAELVLTGRNADESMITHADLVSEILERKHYFAQGVPAREGIEM